MSLWFWILVVVTTTVLGFGVYYTLCTLGYISGWHAAHDCARPRKEVEQEHRVVRFAKKIGLYVGTPVLIGFGITLLFSLMQDPRQTLKDSPIWFVFIFLFVCVILLFLTRGDDHP